MISFRPMMEASHTFHRAAFVKSSCYDLTLYSSLPAFAYCYLTIGNIYNGK